MDDLLKRARGLEAQIQADRKLPSFRRNIQQIHTQASELSANADMDNLPGQLDAQTFRFLAQQGVDATALDPMSLDLAAGPGGPDDDGTYVGTEDLESFLEREEQRIMVDAVDRSKQLTMAEFRSSYWGKVEADWAAEKPRIMEKLRFHADPAAAPAPERPSAVLDVGLHAQGRSRVRGARALQYAHAIGQLWDLRVARQTDFSLVEAMGAAAKAPMGSGPLASSAVKLHTCWQLLGSMVREVQHIRRSGTYPADEAPYMVRDGPVALQLRCALLRGALRHLGEQQLAELRKALDGARHEARRGGLPGTEHDAAAYVRLLARSRASTPAEAREARVSLSEGADEPLWSVLYWCVRCGDLGAAVRVLEAAGRQGSATGAAALLRLMKQLASMQGGGGGGGGGGGVPLADAMRAAQEEYWQQKQGVEEQHQQLLYAVLAAPEPKAKMGDLLPGSAASASIEDWLWYHLSMVLAPMECGVDAAMGSAVSPAAPLFELQRRIGEQYGEAHFNKQGASPLLYFSVLLHSQQFEKAVAFLAREERSRPTAALADMGEEALHFALALQHEGLLACAASGAEAALDGMALERHGRLLLATLLKQHVVLWGAEDPATALQYVWMLRGDPRVREELALEVLQHCGGDGAVLAQPLPFLDLQPPSKRHLTLRLAERLQGCGLSTQAMRLLYQVGTAPPSAGLVARDEDDMRASRDAFARLAELLLEGIATPLVAAHASAGTMRVADAAAPLRADAHRFLQQWQVRDAEGCALLGGPLHVLLQIGELLDTVDAWQQQRRDERGEAALTQALQLLERMPLLPAEPVQVDQKQAAFRQLPPALQCVFPSLLEAAMCTVHAKFLSLRLPRAAGGGNAAELMQLRRRGEAIVAMTGVAAWTAAEALGQLQMPTAISQRLTSWLAEMA